MVWNPSPKVADCREIARKWGNQDQVIILAIDDDGQMQMATYGRTRELCAVAQALGNAAWKGIEGCIAAHERMLDALDNSNANTMRLIEPDRPRAGDKQDALVGGSYP